MRPVVGHIILSVVLMLAVAPVVQAACYPVTVPVMYPVCTDWWDGTRSCHWQEGTEEVEYCEGAGGGGPRGSGGGPIYPPPYPPEPPPELEILSISDFNPGQPLMTLRINSAVIEITVAYDGYTVLTTGPTTQVFLQPLNVLGPNTTITVQARNASNTYASALAHVTRTEQEYVELDSVYAVWTIINPTGEPTQKQDDWTRAVRLFATETSYDVPTAGARNGLYEHNRVEDYLNGYRTTTPTPAWETKYLIDNPQLANVYYGWACGGYSGPNANVCTDVNAFVRAGSPKGRAIILDFDIPFQSGLVSLFTGTEVVVGPD